MKRIACLFMCFLLFAVTTGAADTQERIPTSVDVEKSKSELRPGESLTITLKNFRDASGQPADARERIVVVPNAGVILDGVSPTMPMGPTTQQKAFLPGPEGEFSFVYRAPLHCRKDHVLISVFNSLAYGSTEKIPMDTTEPYEPIATIKIPLNCGTYLLLRYDEVLDRRTGQQRDHHEIRAVLRIDCEPWVADNMLKITNLSILEFYGRAERTSSTESLMCSAESATANFYNSLLLLHLDPETEEIKGLIYEAVPLAIDWHGDEIPEGPPDKIKVGPVSEYRPDKKASRRAGKKLAHDFPTEDRNARRLRRMQQTMIEQCSETRVHPDHRVKSTQGDVFFSGEGRWEKRFSNGHHRRTYHWELYISEE